MHLSRARAAALLLAVLTAGCVSNMDDLKLKLGAVDPPPVVLPPLAKAQANATSALVEVPLRFTADGSKDPQNLPLAYTWRFGDASTGEGALVTHAYAMPGEYVVRVTVVNDKGLADSAAITVQVAPGNHKPVASFTVAPASGVMMGQKVDFDATPSSDVDRDALSYAWDFGDGATALTAKATHAYGAPGLHTARLRVTDPAGAFAETTRVVAVGGAYDFNGAFDAATTAPQSKTFTLAQGATSLDATLTFASGVGNDLALAIKDATGHEVARSAPPGTAAPATPTGTSERHVAVPADLLARQVPGAWTLVVEDVMSPGGVAWTASVRETLDG